MKPKEQVLAEAPGAHLGTQILVGGGDEAHVHGNGLAPSDALDLTGFQRAQQLGLRISAQVPHLVQKERSPVCQLEAPPAALRGTRERTPLVPEQFGLHQVARNRRAVHARQRPTRAR